MTEDKNILDYLLLLRFGTRESPLALPPILNFAAIAKLVRRSPETVRRLIGYALQALKDAREVSQKPRGKLKSYHIEFLCSHNTLRDWAHLSLLQRARMFHRSFPEIKISATLLQKTYKKHGIKYKYIQRGKKIIDYNNQYYLNLFTEMFQSVKAARLRDKKLVWVDEAIFTFNTLGSKAWSSKYDSISVEEKDARIKTMALIAAISEDRGLEGFVIHPKSISTPEFVAFVQQLSDRFGGGDFCMFMDNLQVHKTDEVNHICKEKKVQKIFNVPYSPDFNGIESYFSLLKGEFKRRMLQQLLRGFRPDTESLIRESLEAVEKEKVQKCVEYGLKCIMQKA